VILCLVQTWLMENTGPPEGVLERLREEPRVWMTTLRVIDGSPHTTPVWFVYEPGRWWVASDARNVKIRNLEHDPRVSLALENGIDPVVAEGVAQLRCDHFPAEVVKRFADKYGGWDIESTRDQSAKSRVLIGISHDRWLLCGSAQ